MIDIQKLAQLTGLDISSEQEEKLRPQLESVVTLLEKVKNYDVEDTQESWYDLLGLESLPSIQGSSDGIPEALIENIDHTIVGHAIEVKAFVE